MKKLLQQAVEFFHLGNDLKEAQSKAYNLVQKVDFEGAFCRKDIGFKGIK